MTAADIFGLLQDLMNRLGCSNLYSDAGFADLDADVRSNYLMNTSLSGISQADVVLLVGSNPRTEAPVLNARCVTGCTVHAERMAPTPQHGSSSTHLQEPFSGAVKADISCLAQRL